MNQNEATLKVYNASAGSGKTYTLVKEYLKLLFSSPSDDHFSSIIAMTFTNLAALEMKERIIKELDTISYISKENFERNQLAISLADELKLSPEQIIHKSKKILKALLHQYEGFSVVTIDKFNLRLIKSFKRELNLPENFEVELNKDKFFELIIEKLFQKLNQQSANDEINKILLDYSMTKIEDEEKINFKKELLETISKIFEENNHEILANILSKNFDLSDYYSTKNEAKQINEKLKQKASNILHLFGGHDVLTKEAGKRLLVLSIDGFNDNKPTKFEKFFYAKKEVPSTLKDLVDEIEEYFNKEELHFLELMQYLKSFHKISLLKYIIEIVNETKEKDHIILISEFNDLVSKLVQVEDAPFIYEKLGTKYQHFMLDEFQDTSHLQWLNMIPLIHESLSQQHTNLIVGDPKQSIYRFRGAQAQQFVALPKIYNPKQIKEIEIKSNYFNEAANKKHINLEDNWRSADEIIQFNNTLFPVFRSKLDPEHQNFYASITQNPKKNLKGYVYIKSQKIESKNEVEHVHSEIHEVINKCVEDGFLKSDICILVNRKKEARLIAEYLLERDIQIVSNESLDLKKNKKVCLTIDYIKHRLHPKNKQLKLNFFLQFLTLKNEDTFSIFEKYKIDDKYNNFDDEAFIKNYFGGNLAFYFSFENIYDLITKFYQQMNWVEISDPFLHQFSDIAFDFEKTKGPNIEEFLNFLELNKKLFIQTPENNQAVNILTTHKSKGLEFPVVIIYNCDSTYKSKNELIESEQNVFEVKLSRSSRIDVVREKHNQDINMYLLDKMNQLYVAFTRPINRLYAFNYYSNPSKDALENNIISRDRVGYQLKESLIEAFNPSGENESFELSFGEETKIMQTEKSKNNTADFYPVNVNDQLWFPEIALTKKKTQDENQLSEEQKFGNQFHFVMSEINDIKEFDKHIDQWIYNGDVDIANKDLIHQKVIEVFANEEFNQLFVDAHTILNERSIIINQLEQKRPDKVIIKQDKTIIIDYKTGQEKDKDLQQIKEYIQLFREMNYPNVKGYLYYTDKGKIKIID